MVATPLDPSTLPSNDNITSYCYCIENSGEYFLQKGAMLAYYGQMRFENLMSSSVPNMVARQFGSPTGMNEWVLARGHGKLLLGRGGLELNSYTLEDGNLTVRARNLLGFDPTLELKQSIIPGYLNLIGSGTFVAGSNGPVMFAEPPIRVDPQALLGWSDTPTPCVHFDTNWMTGLVSGAQAFFGRRSGEEEQYDFTGSGTVLIQSSEIVSFAEEMAIQQTLRR
ncbi:AIM24 family protein [Nakamurella sp. YIM 132087]|uniref:AIM24 family protein n=1 Tax=Nakamurella alba TaxID=2665158 RepID=A0A7K1FU21_9ACTN|nr:AIM24 family protein [Nakamurella alba]MTD16334.1 AIM24 family protein [Nakamurella alba]